MLHLCIYSGFIHWRWGQQTGAPKRIRGEKNQCGGRLGGRWELLSSRLHLTGTLVPLSHAIQGRTRQASSIPSKVNSQVPTQMVPPPVAGPLHFSPSLPTPGSGYLLLHLHRRPPAEAKFPASPTLFRATPAASSAPTSWAPSRPRRPGAQ